MPSSIDSHPQRATIIEGLLAGKSLRSLSKAVTPHVTPMALQRFKAKHIDATLEGAGVLSKALQTLANAAGSDVVPVDPAAVTRAALLADPYLARIARHQQTIDKSLVTAQADGDGRTVAALISTDLKGLELDARLSGRLDSAAGSTTIQIVTPAVTINAGNTPAADMMTIDIGPER